MIPSHADPESRSFDRWGFLARQFCRFLAVGCAGLAVDMAVFAVLHGAGLSRPSARAVSLALATLTTWGINRRVTFAATGRRRREEIARYAGVVLVSQGFSYGSFLTISAVAPQLPALWALLIGAVAAAGLSFCGQRFFTFLPVPQETVR